MILGCVPELKSSPQQADNIYFLSEFIYFNWRLITLQYCIGFSSNKVDETGAYYTE